MIILATVLLGPGSETIVGEAIASAAAAVDGYMLIDSGGGDAALQAAIDATIAVQKPATIREYTWTGDYGDARQAALNWARYIDGGCDYALTLDPDERLVLGDSFRAHLEAYPSVDVWILPDRDTGYFKERAIKTSTQAKWHGRVCEFLGGREVAGSKLPGHFWELQKDEGAEKRRWQRGIVECTRMIAEGDDCYRWRRHRGSCFMGMGQSAEALADYEAALPQALNPDETAWMRYLICEQYVLAGRIEEARELAANGLADHAGFIPEFGWILCYTDYKADRMQNASRWAQLVLNTPADRTRIGFRGHNCKTGAKSVLQDIHRPVTENDFDPEDFKYRQVAFRDNYARVAAALRGLLAPKSHLDLGAGQGLLVEAMSKSGVVTHGVELSENAWNACPKDIQQLIMFGVGVDGWEASQQADLVTCVEVLEHVPESEADRAVAAICGRSKRWVYFSAAAPGQPGKGHVNCQPKKYWRAKFEANGFLFAEAETAGLVGQIKDLQPCEWLPKNAMIFKREGALS